MGTRSFLHASFIKSQIIFIYVFPAPCESRTTILYLITGMTDRFDLGTKSRVNLSYKYACLTQKHVYFEPILEHVSPPLATDNSVCEWVVKGIWEFGYQNKGFCVEQDRSGIKVI